ncbi:murein hydrolase activator EnvC family protein [Sphingomonas immobilis]|uniref:Peptidoglycan DD-metalloendopeptidase family protein n=1 Tax=Sphingomonas immobilis TaxID=3063997 RepID=A0ABT8ZVT7_9SPHN|nr:peptidoglycan DD-metalloendopeptidase family protein [Sphingomonas sp. CA1-15]MDO7841688.1 peptidoglycan DD-metalloendopeptidase family protein [Sphingomonas sp. CA1-15]
MRGGLILCAVTGTAVIAAVAVAQGAPENQAGRLAMAKAESVAAAARSAALEAAATREKDEAARARTQEAAVAARVQQAEADIAAGQARIAITGKLLADQRARLAEKQGPIARLIAALQSLARRPSLISIVQPGSVDDLVHVRAVLASTMPIVRARTAALRADLDRTRALQADATLAAAALAESRTRLEAQRLALTRLEAEHRLKSRALGRDALFESDRAIALGERARDIVDLMTKLGDQASVRESLATLPGPLPRPPRPGEVASPLDTVSWSAAAPPYRLPVVGRIVTGFGELSDSGVRSRGLTIASAPAAQVIAPAVGRVAYAGPFRDYGTIVILDHGGGWTTLVDGLAATTCKVGERIAQGAPIGRAGEGEDARVTVELRRRDRPVDMTPLVG